MRSLSLANLVLALTVSSTSATEPVKTHQVRLNGHAFTLPVGFDIELAAGPPLVNRPISMDFDEQGRLYVTDSSGSNERVQEQLKKKPHRVVRLEDTTGSGRFDKSTLFADQMMFPEGCLWYNGSLYVAAPPSIWKLTDTKGTGAADQRVEWFKGKTLTGCANDLHGPYLGPDGWIYWCKGAFAQQTYERPGKPPFVTRAAHIFRARPDGSGIEPVMTGGMDNPVNLVFTKTGDLIFDCTFLQFPGGGRRDGLIHAIYGGIYGKDWDVIHDPVHKWTGPNVMPVMTHLGAAAPCGLVRYESQVFGAEYQDNLFACLFNMQKVTRHVLIPEGSTYKTHDEDFLVSDNKDYHPTDVKQDADGSLLVIDTGGWYKLCCPTSQLVKPDVLGGVYRIRRLGAQRVNDPRGLKLAWANMKPQDLTDLLGDPRPAVRQRAISTLGAMGGKVLPHLLAVMQWSSAEARRDAVWTACRIDHPQARFIVSVGVDLDPMVAQATLNAISLWRDTGTLWRNTGDREGKYSLFERLRGSPSARRVAAEALGRIGHRSDVPALLEAATAPADRALEHAIIYALIEIGAFQETAEGLKSTNPRVRRAALIALDQMDKGNLDAADVVRELTTSDPALKEAAWWIAGRHPEWGEALAKFLRQHLTQKMSPAERETWAKQLARFAHAPAVQKLLAERLGDAGLALESRRLLLQAMAQSGLRQTPPEWTTALLGLLETKDAGFTREVVATLRALPLPKNPPSSYSAALVMVGLNARLSAEVRLEALALLGPAVPHELPTFFDLARGQLGANQSVAARNAALEVLGKTRLSREQLLVLVDCVKKVGPMEINRLVEAFAQTKEEEVGRRLLAALKESPAKSALRREPLKAAFAKTTPPLRKQADEFFESLNADTAKQQARLEELLAATRGGDIRRGQAVFNSAKAACSSCHAIGYLGGNIGPDLTQIGRIRTGRDLLEAIVYPSASFVRGYEPVVVTTKSGKVHNGVIRRDNADELLLAVGPNQEVRIPRSEIEEVQPSRVSVMPAGLDQQLTQRDLADLLAFLKACK